jgi:hypothetical protein
VNNNEFWFDFSNHIEFKEVIQFNEILFCDAAKLPYYKYVLLGAIDKMSHQEAFSKMQTSITPKEVVKLLLNLNWNPKEVMTVLDLQSPLMLFYFKDIFPQISQTNARQKAVIPHWNFQLYGMIFPQYKRKFISFIVHFNRSLHEQTVYSRLKELNFVEGMLCFASERKDVKREISLSLTFGDCSNVISHLSAIENH